MKLWIIIIIASFFASHHSVQAQWEPVDLPIIQPGFSAKLNEFGDGNSMYLYGYTVVYDENGVSQGTPLVLSWINEDTLIDFMYFDGWIRNINLYQGDTIITGSFHSAFAPEEWPEGGPNSNSVSFSGRIVNGILEPFGEFNGSVWSRVIDGYLYMYGLFTEAMGYTCNVIRWDGENWEPVGPPIEASNCAIQTAMIFQGDFYVAGNIITENGKLDNLVLKNGVWQALDETMSAAIAHFNAMEVYQGELYAGGLIRKIDGFAGNMIQRWNGEAWSEVGNSLYGFTPSTWAQLYEMKVYNGHLYACGLIQYAGGEEIRGIVRWDGSQWCGFNIEGIQSVMSFAIWNNYLYVIHDGIEPFMGSETFLNRFNLDNEVFPCSEVFTSTQDASEDELVFNIFPNPTSSYLTLTGSALLPGSELKVYNVAGQQVYSEVLPYAHETHTLDARRFGPAGLYLLHLNTPGHTPVVKKVVVQE